MGGVPHKILIKLAEVCQCDVTKNLKAVAMIF